MITNKNRTAINNHLGTAKGKPQLRCLAAQTAVWMLFLILLLCGIPAHAGQESSSSLDLKQVAPETPNTSLDEPWKFTLGVPGWMPGVYGTVGIKGISSSVSQDFGDLLPHLEGVASVEAGAQKGKFGVYGSLLYMSLGDEVGRQGLLSSVNLHVNEYLADFGFDYRIVEGPRGWLDAIAGCRYTNLYQRASLYPDDGAIDSASARIVDGISQRILDKLSASGLGDDLKTLIAQNVLDRLQTLAGEHPDLPIGPVGGSELDRLTEEIKRIVQRLDPDIAAAIIAEGQAKTATLKLGAQQRVDYLKRKLADEIASRLHSALNQSFSKTNYWFDPYVGLRGRLNINKAFYLTGRADIGGFGVGSQLTWQTYGALGCQLTRYIYAEAGYRCLFMNYRGGGLIYDTYTRGVEINVGVAF